MPCFSMFYSSFCSMLMLGLHARMLDIMSMVMPCLDLCVLCIYFHAIWLDPCLHMLICLDSCPSMSMCLIAMCLHACFYAYMSMSMLPHACVFGSMLSSCFCYIPCACVLHAMFMCLDLGYVCHAMCYYSPFVVLSFFLVFSPSD